MSSSKKNVVPLIMDFIKGGNSQPASKPGFGHAVKLSYNVIAKERLSWNETKKSLTYRYKFVNNTPASTGLLVALMDELTTDACFGYGQPSAPGLSLQMQMQLVSGGPLLSTYSELDIVSTVTKLGRTISFVKCDFYDTTTTAGKLVAFGSHVKYMPTGSFFTDLVFTKSWAWNLYTSVLLGKSSPKYYEEKDLIKEVIGAHLDYQGLGSATFNITEEHMNPFGGMHGGCHAVLMELVGQTLVGREATLESIQIDFVAAARGSVRIVAAPLVPENLLQMRVCIYDVAKNNRLVSDGKLMWSSSSSSSSSSLQQEQQARL